MTVGEEYMWVADRFAYPRRVVIEGAEPDSQRCVRVRCYDNDGTSYITWANPMELKKGDSMHVIKPEANDPVSHPSHYTNGSIECIDAMEAAFGRREVIIFSKLNAFKYLWRAELKNNELQDLEKASWYLNKAIELLKEEAESGMEEKDILKCDRCHCDHG